MGDTLVRLCVDQPTALGGEDDPGFMFPMHILQLQGLLIDVP